MSSSVAVESSKSIVKSFTTGSIGSGVSVKNENPPSTSVILFSPHDAAEPALSSVNAGKLYESFNLIPHSAEG